MQHGAFPTPRTRAKPTEFCATPSVDRCASWCGTHCGPTCCASSRWVALKAAALLRQHPVQSLIGAPCGPRLHGGCTSSTPLREKDGRRRRVLLWQGERNADGRLGFMYWPVVGSLIAGFRFLPVEIVVGLGFSLAWHRELKLLQKGDVFVWVGEKKALPRTVGTVHCTACIYDCSCLLRISTRASARTIPPQNVRPPTGTPIRMPCKPSRPPAQSKSRMYASTRFRL